MPKIFTDIKSYNSRKPEHKMPDNKVAVRKTDAPSTGVNIREQKLPTEKKVVENKFSYEEKSETKPYNAFVAWPLEFLIIEPE